MRTALKDNPARVLPAPDANASMHAAWRKQFDSTLGRFGAPFHVVLAMFACACAAGPQVAIELGVLPLLVCWVLRWPFIIQGLRHVLASPVALCFLALLVWSTLALLWSPSMMAGQNELRYWRWGWLLLALWPVMHARHLLIASLAVGFVVANGAQLVEALALTQGVVLFHHPPTATPFERICGWWHHPVHGGVMLSAAFGLHVGPALFGAGKVRLVALLGASIALVGVIATGTRGALLACIVVAGGLVLIRAGLWWQHASRLKAPRGSRGEAQAPGMQQQAGAHRARSSSFAVALIGFVLLVAGVFAAPSMSTRLRTGVVEIKQAWQGNVNSDMGARVVALRSVLDAFSKHPVRGIGLHAFGDHTREFVQREKIALPPERVFVLRTAHNTPAHMLASLGAVGLFLWCALAASIVWSGWHIARARSLHATLGSYAIAPTLAACSMLIAGQFDAIGFNSPTACLATLLAALCVRGVQAERTA